MTGQLAHAPKQDRSRARELQISTDEPERLGLRVALAADARA